MKVTYKLGQNTFSNNTEGNVILTNAKGGFLNLGSPVSKFQGWFVKEGAVFKILEEIKIEGAVTEEVNEIFQVKRCSKIVDFRHPEPGKKNVTETYLLPKNFNSLVYELSKENEIELVFDIRKAYDLSEEGREYKISNVGKKIVVQYPKENIYVVIGNVDRFEKVSEWKEYNYLEDEKRNSPPFVRYNYLALKFKCKKIVITAGRNRVKVLEENSLVLKELSKIKKAEKNALKIISRAKKNLSVNLAANSLLNLIVEEGIYAGLPWFFQKWTRDEMISLRALTLVGEEQLAKKILLERVKQINNNGRLPNRIGLNGLDSADSVGWMFLRFDSILKLLDKKEKELLKVGLKNSIELLIKNYHLHGFFVNAAKETWMDTDYQGDVRSGVRIEIQALMINMFDLAFRLTKSQIYGKLRDSLVKNVREKMFNGMLSDGVGDGTIRPNVFIAYYVCPKLLSKKEWTSVFEKSLDKLWLEWGGISTIDKNSLLFCSSYTGEDNKSYHRGDSWYWLNCLAAIGMLRVNKKKFGEYINKIFAATELNILEQGGLGSCSEVSSAGVQTADGCLNQAWSNAMFIELWKEVNKK